MWFLVFEATPSSEHDGSGAVAGAFVQCWIDRETLQDAALVAQRLIRGERWIVHDPDDAFEVDETTYAVDETTYAVDDPMREFYEQALTDREVLVFHTYPVDEAGDL